MTVRFVANAAKNRMLQRRSTNELYFSDHYVRTCVNGHSFQEHQNGRKRHTDILFLRLADAHNHRQGGHPAADYLIRNISINYLAKESVRNCCTTGAARSR